MADNAVCYDCHGDKDLTRSAEGKEVSLFVEQISFEKSVHGEIGCTGCHTDMEDMEDEHPPEVEPVNCGTCHDEIDGTYGGSVHAKAIQAGVTDSANCIDCQSSVRELNLVSSHEFLIIVKHYIRELIIFFVIKRRLSSHKLFKSIFDKQSFDLF